SSRRTQNGTSPALSLPMKSARQLLMAMALWLSAGAFGFSLLLGYENTPGSGGSVPTQWPGQTHIVRPGTGFALIMFAHPKCPCVRASIGELNRLLAHCQCKFC